MMAANPADTIESHLVYGDFFAPSGDVIEMHNANPVHHEFPYPQWLVQIYHALQAPCEADTGYSLSQEAVSILAAETQIDLSRYDIYTSSIGVQGALAKVIGHLTAGDRKQVVIASPNWNFDELIARVPGAVTRTFFAADAAAFTSGLAANLDDRVAAAIIVDPSNPMGYRLDRAQVAALEEAAGSAGAVLIFDDVYRGAQAAGQMQTASRYSGSSVIIESTTKRFGARGMGAAWTLIPKGLGIKVDGLALDCKGCDSALGLITHALYTTGYGEIIRQGNMLNTKMFTEGFSQAMEGMQYGRFNIPFEGSPYFTYEFKMNKQINSFTLAAMFERFHASVPPGAHWLKIPDRELEPAEAELGLSMLRIAVPRITPDQAHMMGYALGNIVHNYLASSPARK
jgi:aspartate/methionine/tyrosine aminotransferase